MALGSVALGVMMTDTLCPEHRGWVNGLAASALAGSVAAVVALARGSASAAWITPLVAAAGVAVGLIDTLHAPRRGALVALGLGLVALASTVLLARDVRLRRWDRDVRGQARDDRVALPAPVDAGAAPAETPARRTSRTR